MTFFLESNGWSPIDITKNDYREIINKIFGNHKLEDYENFSPTDFAMYNVALITAKFNENGIDYDEGKSRFEKFLSEVFTSE